MLCRLNSSRLDETINRGPSSVSVREKDHVNDPVVYNYQSSVDYTTSNHHALRVSECLSGTLYGTRTDWGCRSWCCMKAYLSDLSG